MGDGGFHKDLSPQVREKPLTDFVPVIQYRCSGTFAVCCGLVLPVARTFFMGYVFPHDSDPVDLRWRLQNNNAHIRVGGINCIQDTIYDTQYPSDVWNLPAERLESCWNLDIIRRLKSAALSLHLVKIISMRCRGTASNTNGAFELSVFVDKCTDGCRYFAVDNVKVFHDGTDTIHTMPTRKQRGYTLIVKYRMCLYLWLRLQVFYICLRNYYLCTLSVYFMYCINVRLCVCFHG